MRFVWHFRNTRIYLIKEAVGSYFDPKNIPKALLKKNYFGGHFCSFIVMMKFTYLKYKNSLNPGIFEPYLEVKPRII